MGLPKSGTSHLQSLLAENRPALRAAGYIYPFIRPEGMFHAATELRGQEALWGLDPELVGGTWRAMLDRVRDEPTLTGVISHEILAGAAPAVVEQIVRDTADFELHVVVTARDLGRQAVAHWQEEIKNGRPWSFAEFESAVFGPEESAEHELGFWRSQDVPGVLGRWALHLPAERLHLVTVPRGADPGLLRQRFGEAVDLASGLPGEDAGLVNTSLGVPQTALLRQVVAALGDRIAQPAYAHVVKRWFAQNRLAARPGRRLEPTPELAARLREIALSWHDQLAQYTVHGDPADLVPMVDPGAAHPDDVAAEELWAEAPAVIADLLAEVADLRTETAAARTQAPAPRRRLPGVRRKA